ncbi:N-acetylglucosaminyltransferase [Ptychographa xylographoides]|nr:N-acetylglucosaminyltransferase [Ptychographa xylographoides]
MKHARHGVRGVPTLHDLYDPNSNYDSDDSSPPTSPKPWSYRPSRITPRSVYWQFRRLRPLLLTLAAVGAIFYYSTHYHRRLFPPKHAPSFRYKDVDWRRFAYTQYATDSHYLCNSLMVFEALDRLGSRAERVLMYPEEWDTDVANQTDRDSQLLVKAVNAYNVKLVPVKVRKFRRDPRPGETKEETDGQDTTWDTSLTKFLAFNQTQYLRIIHFDSDATVLGHMDDLFLLPAAPVAMMRAHWVLPHQKKLTSMFILLEPSAIEAGRLAAAADATTRKDDDFDMEILDSLYADSAMVLPHRRYGLLSGEFRALDGHERYLGNDYEAWDPARALREASLVHFSDWPIPKPWIMWPRELLKENVPRCEIEPGTSRESRCGNREVWLELYNDFRRRRKDICALLSVPAPQWPPKRESGSNSSWAGTGMG